MKKILSIALLLTFFISSCNNDLTDDDVKNSAQTELAKDPVYSGLTVTVKNGIVELNGEAPNDATRITAEEKLIKITGVKSVQNNATVKGLEIK